MKTSTPKISEFDPRDVPYQYQVIKDVRRKYDYKLGAHEILLSGSVGSAKSILMAHLILTHCLTYPKARACIARRALPDLKQTLFLKIKEHMEGDLVRGVDYDIHESSAHIQFANGSEIISRSWADKHYSKLRSLELSCAAIEELTENDTQDAFDELKMRVNRLSHVPEHFTIAATNPDSPSHWAYKYFMLSESSTRHVYYSVTSDNKFLPESYIRKLKEDLDPKMVERMVYGKWLDIAGETVYYQYDRDTHFKNEDYRVQSQHPIYITWDFNIGEGKPMSVIAYQYIDDTFHFFDEFVVHGARTEVMMEEIWNRGIFDNKVPYFGIQGDATGSHRSTNSNWSNYEIIFQYLDRKGIKYEKQILRLNPPIKKRHNIVNAYLKNSYGHVRVYLYKKCKVADEGCRLVKLKEGGHYIEDDSKYYQHITTAMGYGINYLTLIKERGQSQTIT